MGVARRWAGPYLPQRRQRPVDGGCLHQPLTLRLRLGDALGAGEVTQGERPAGRESGDAVGGLHLQRHHQVGAGTGQDAAVNADLGTLSPPPASPLRVHPGGGDPSVLLSRLHDDEDVGLGPDQDLAQPRNRHGFTLSSDLQDDVGVFSQKIFEVFIIDLQHGNLTTGNR